MSELELFLEVECHPTIMGEFNSLTRRFQRVSFYVRLTLKINRLQTLGYVDVSNPCVDVRFFSGVGEIRFAGVIYVYLPYSSNAAEKTPGKEATCKFSNILRLKMMWLWLSLELWLQHF